MADFRNTTNEFKATWQREVDFEEEVRAIRTLDSDEPEPMTIARGSTSDSPENTIAAPEVKEVSSDIFTSPTNETRSESVETSTDDNLSDKRSWL